MRQSIWQRPYQPCSLRGSHSRLASGNIPDIKAHDEMADGPCLGMQARASGSEATAESAFAASPASTSGRGNASASSSAVDAEGSHASAPASKAKRKKASKHASPQLPAQEAVAEEIPVPDPPSTQETKIAKAVLRRMHRLRHQAPNAEQLIQELGDPDPNDPACIAEIVDHMRLSHALDPVGGVPQGELSS